MKALTITLAIAVLSASASAQPVRLDKYVNNVQQMPQERVNACASGCYVLTTDELAKGFAHVARLAQSRTICKRDGGAKA